MVRPRSTPPEFKCRARARRVGSVDHGASRSSASGRRRAREGRRGSAAEADRGGARAPAHAEGVESSSPHAEVVRWSAASGCIAPPRPNPGSRAPSPESLRSTLTPCASPSPTAPIPTMPSCSSAWRAAHVDTGGPRGRARPVGHRDAEPRGVRRHVRGHGRLVPRLRVSARPLHPAAARRQHGRELRPDRRGARRRPGVARRACAWRCPGC